VFLRLVALQLHGGGEDVVLDRESVESDVNVLGFLKAGEFVCSGKLLKTFHDVFLEVA
jgi:hypothetical protein